MTARVCVWGGVALPMTKAKTRKTYTDFERVAVMSLALPNETYSIAR